MVSDPLNMFDVAPNADGAAALILTRPDLLPPGYPAPAGAHRRLERGDRHPGAARPA